MFDISGFLYKAIVSSSNSTRLTVKIDFAKMNYGILCISVIFPCYFEYSHLSSDFFAWY